MELMLKVEEQAASSLPAGWETNDLGNLTSKVGSGITPTGGSRVYKADGRPFIRSQNVGWGSLILDDVVFIDDATHERFPDTEILLDDVLLNITGASIGRSAIADRRIVGGNVNQHVCIIRPLRYRLHPRFLNTFLLSDFGQQQIDSFQAGGNRQGLNFGQIRSFQIPTPPLHEQQAIATALGDVDALLDALDRLIAKKRDMKQAAMQQLLTGQTRLPGFSGAWETKRLGEVCQMRSGETITVRDLDDSFPFPCYGGNGLRGYADRYTHEGEFALIGRQGALCGNVIGVRGRFFASEHAIVVTAYEGMSIGWLSRVLDDLRLNRYSESSAQPGLSVSKLLEIEVVVPPSEAEQRAIAAVLSDMDAEIEALEAHRAKTQKIKQGMMQELLTGKTRLV